MKFIIDIQIPNKICSVFEETPYSAVHIGSLANGLYWTDAEVLDYALQNDFILFSKTQHLVKQYLDKEKLPRIILIDSENTTNNEIIRIISNQFDELIKMIDKDHFVIVQSHKISLLKK